MHIVLWARPVLEHQSHVAPPKAYRLGSLNGLNAANLTIWKHQRVVGFEGRQTGKPGGSYCRKQAFSGGPKRELFLAPPALSAAY
jgi:hypothetical protein